jgi:hypothetical protein
LEKTSWEILDKESKAMLLKALKQFKEQAVAGLVSLGTKQQVSRAARLCWHPRLMPPADSAHCVVVVTGSRLRPYLPQHG